MSKYRYFHGSEAEQFSFFRIPRTLIKDERFHGLSTEAKLLYGLMLDRMGLSLRNGWLDEENRVFIFYTLQEVQETLRCGHNKATRLLNELEQYGLIERVRQGQGKPAKIYVKNFAEEESLGQGEDEKADLKISEKSTCRLPVSKPLDCPKGAGIYTDKNYTDNSHTNLSIYPPTPSARQMEIDRYDCLQRATLQAKAAKSGLVTASMAFVKHKRPLVRGQQPPNTPSPRNTSHRETYSQSASHAEMRLSVRHI